MDRYFWTNTLIFNLFLFLTFLTSKFIILIPLIPYIIFIACKYKGCVKWFLIIWFFMIIALIQFRPMTNNYYHTATVKKVYSTSLLVSEDGRKYYIYGIQDTFMPGDVITFEGRYYPATDYSSFSIFWKAKGAIAQGHAYDVELVSHHNSIRNKLFSSFLNDHSNYSQGILALLYGISTEYNSFLLDITTKLGVSHLFVLSGFHIALFFIAIETIGNKIIKNKRVVNLIALSIALIFLYFLYFPLTGIRALLTMQIIRLHRNNRIDSLCITGNIFFCINPFILFTSSMILSFSITAAIYILSRGGISFRETVTISIVAFYCSLPTITTWDDEANLLAPLINILLTPLISFTYIFSLIIMPFHFLRPIANLYFSIFDIVIISMSRIYIPLNLELLTLWRQYLATITTLIYICIMRGNRVILLNTFFSMSIIFFII